MTTWANYCLTYQSIHKRKRMNARFTACNLQVKFFEGVHALDPVCVPDQSELAHAIEHKCWDPHAWSVLHGHLLIMHDFLTNSDKEFLCVMEDDVHIRKDFLQEQPVIQSQFKKMKLDMCMLGYLTPYQLAQVHHTYDQLTPTYTYLQYPFNVYGTQMYLTHRTHAQHLWDTYGVNSEWRKTALSTGDVQPADWIITKQGIRACIYPMMAVEELGGGHIYQDLTQREFHDECHRMQFNAELYV